MRNSCGVETNVNSSSTINFIKSKNNNRLIDPLVEGCIKSNMKGVFQRCLFNDRGFAIVELYVIQLDKICQF